MRRVAGNSGAGVRLRADAAGFTMVELLVVMLVMGLLAAVAIPMYLNQQEKARDAEAKASVRVAQTASETIATDNGGEYDGASGVTVANLVEVEPTLRDASLSVPVVGARTYTVRVQSDTGNTFDIRRNSDGTVDMRCASAGRGGCPPDAVWGR